MKRMLIATAFSLLALAVHGFHYGIEDESIYLPAVKRLLNPGLFPHDAALVEAQTRLTLFPPLMAGVARITRLPLPWIFFLGYCATTFLFVLAVLGLAERLFEQPAAQYSALALVIPLLTMPVAGTALFLMDQHLHPRNIATVLILFAVMAMLDQRPAPAGAFVVGAIAVHPLVGLFGGCLVAFQKWRWWLWLMPVGLIGARLVLGDAPEAWKAAMGTQQYYLVTSWTWYEWLGVAGPLIGFELCARWGRPGLRLLCRQLAIYGVVFLAAGVAVSTIPWLYRLAPLQPMRSLQLLYILFFLILGGMLAHPRLIESSVSRVSAPSRSRFRAGTETAMGEHHGDRTLVWGLLVILCVGMFLAQRAEFPGSAHIELPGVRPANHWLQGFAWIRENTPQDAYFAMNPRYLELRGEDFHGFRGLAERSMLADDIEDRAVATVDPRIAETWLKQVDALRRWKDFRAEDLRSLKNKFGVDWVLLETAHGASLADCPYKNESMAVCRLD